MSTTEAHWWDDHDNVVMLAYWMRERDHGVDDFVTLIEKPWKWTDEYEEAVADNAAEEAAATEDASIPPEVLASKKTMEFLQNEFRAGFDEGRPT